MASVTKLPRGEKALQFYDHTEKRRTIRVGKLTQKQAERMVDRIEALVAARATRSLIDADTVEWLAEVSDTIHAKLVGFDLCSPRVEVTPAEPEPTPEVVTVGKFLADYLAMRTDVRPLTMRNLKESAARVEKYLGKQKPIAEVTALDADGYNLHLRQTLGENTVRRLVSRARQFFAAALRGRLVTENPFGHLKNLKVRSVKERQAFVSRETTYKLLDAAPDAEWRAIIGLARFVGLRVPSELFKLRWEDIDWATNRITIHSPKTATFGKSKRVVPIFPEVLPLLLDVAESRPEKSEFVVSKYRVGCENLRTGLLRIAKRAGVEPWPKLFVNLRASRATELAEHYPGYLAAEWLGHSEAVANEHYRQVTEDQFRRAATEATGALHGALQYTAESSGTEGKQKREPLAAAPIVPVFSALFASTGELLVPLRGFEPRLPD
ncbi:MAG: tyrosine-type recombinase/integrase [Planctomycetaceae bacterium]|nr:tyrosine-type recombinase/integrase [Planctomycetaceae bacterium]